MCTSLLPTTITFAEEGDIQETAINVVQTTGSAVTVSATSDSEFDAATGTITGYNGSDSEIVTPSEINGVKVTSIGDYAFARCDNAIFYVESEKVKQLLINAGVDERKIILNGQSSQ